MNSRQDAIYKTGREIFAQMERQRPSLFSRHNLTNRLLQSSMQNEALKTQLFRLVDVLPAIDSSKEIAEHAREYLAHSPDLPWYVRVGLPLSNRLPPLTAFAARHGVQQMAKSFILAKNASEAVPLLEIMRQRPIAFTVDILGELALNEQEAVTYQTRYLDLLHVLARSTASWPHLSQIDQDDRGPIPKMNVSVKISALYSQIHPADPADAMKALANRLTPILRKAQEIGAFINFDMEHTGLKGITIELFKELFGKSQFKSMPSGLALQAYLRSSESDLKDLIHWAKIANRPITIRLIKGAYWDHETILAQQRNWPVPVFDHKPETDVQFERLARLMLENHHWIRPAFGTHNIRSIAACIVHARECGLSQSAYEFQMLYGMAEPIKDALVKMGYRLREYCPIGETLPGMSYLVRRLLENTSNEGFLRAAFTTHTTPEELLRDPADQVNALHARPKTFPSRSEQAHSQGWPRPQEHSNTAPIPMLPRFRNEPCTDFTSSAHRQKMADAIAQVRTLLGETYPLMIGGNHLETRQELISINPSRPDQVIGRLASADCEQAQAAIINARIAYNQWRRTSAEERAKLLERVAELLAQKRFQFAALEIFETGHTWTGADADVCEAIDFCRFYAAEMRRISRNQSSVPGESTLHETIPRGLAAIIAPWNFPLAILCGMTTAALVTGNAVIMKPAEQSSVIAAWFKNILDEAGIPPGVVTLLPGVGEVVGRFLVEHPQVNVIGFTGSRAVGLQIYAAAAQHRPGQSQLKNVICEMGGKNPLIIDSDADLDEAIPAILQSAYGYQGQKCSALARLIVHQNIHDHLLERLIPAIGDMKIGNPELPGTLVGPVIDNEAYDRIHQYITLGKTEATLAFQGAHHETQGFFIPPTLFTDVPPDSRLAQVEIFGPVLSVFKARDFDHAVALANNTEYALTAGVFSRNPAHIEQGKRDLHAGNVYINRGITGALVGRHPFGGFKMSGGGTKAGGRDYLQHFLFTRVITENLMRRGFAPDPPTDENSG